MCVCVVVCVCVWLCVWVCVCMCVVCVCVCVCIANGLACGVIRLREHEAKLQLTRDVVKPGTTFTKSFDVGKFGMALQCEKALCV